MIRYLSDTRVKENGVDNSDTLLKSELNYKYSKMTKSWVSYRDYLLAVENRAEPFRLRGSASETSELHAALRSNLIALATAAKAMELREHPNSTDAKKAVVDAFQVLHAKGLNATSFDPQVEDSRWYTEGRHTLPPETYIWAIRESSAFAMSLLLARDYLSETPQALDDALATLHAHTKQYGADQIHKYMDSYFGTISGMESDMARILLLGRLCYCLSLPESGDGFGTRAAHMDAWHAYAEKTFAVSSDVLDSFKPDGTMFHHYMHYGVDYSYVLVNYIVIVQSALKGTPWELSQSAGMVAARSFLGLLMYTSNNHDAVQSVSGRLNSVGAVSTYVSTYALLPELFQEVKNRFGEALWDAVRATTNPPWQGDNRGYYGNPGAIKPWFDAYRNATNNTAKATSGAAMFPYSGLMTFSDTGLGDSAGFIVAAKGYSLFVRNNYEREHNLNNNNVYQSAGSLCVLSRANGAATFGKKGQFYQDGFDWYRMPGVTAPHRDPSECNSGTIL
ncbi:MAG: chondroitinase family polysaccharide lyase, partial [Promethearchaeia archaeon]